MRKRMICFLSLTMFLTISVSAQNSPKKDLPSMPSDFRSDNCSLFPDGDYADCCVEHDRAYYFGGSWKARWRADKKLFQCVAAKVGLRHKFIAPVMWLGVRVGGVSWLPTPFRWGFGKTRKPKKPRCPPRNVRCSA